MTELIYEQPLNEKIRSYLRLEYLSAQLQQNLTEDLQHRCFYPLFSLCELTDRCDYRSDVLKDIDRNIILLSKWLEQPEVHKDQVHHIINRLIQAKAPLQTPDRIGVHLKKEKFICALRQRFGMPGACCNFDLPQLHFWLAKSWQERQLDIQCWIDQFEPLLTPVSLLLELIRNTAEFNQADANAGFYQSDSSQALALIRVKIDAKYGCYPTISGHRNRYAIHFVDFDQQRHTDKTIQFLLATCS
ncbi:cell division protein ZapD [Shewanella aestuarii]|uniref:Cell division protein ZapD n=1 Tax=Shewanella aestuarii TaxID=1028752 RepID=A0A6G9QHF6_9GAMM|nr:cell division protein ZapD [Shewanella aestuarii]QIR13331.1 cell division protein ZapD [Shewanella aestuarii]